MQSPLGGPSCNLPLGSLGFPLDPEPGDEVQGVLMSTAGRHSRGRPLGPSVPLLQVRWED